MLGMTEKSIIEIARVTIELTAPLSIGSGDLDTLDDSPIVRDIQGLPMIPATSIVGTIRSLWRNSSESNQAKEDILFGHQSGNEGARSLLSASSAMIHNHHNQPVSAMGYDEKDPVLNSAKHDIMTRDHVRLNHRGVTDGRGKFDRNSLQKGHRFTFELSLRRSPNEETGNPSTQDFMSILALLNSDACRFGAKSNSGLGAFKVYQCLYGLFDLSKASDFQNYLQHPSELWLDCQLDSIDLNAQKAGFELNLDLVPQEAWLQGGGDEDLYYNEASKSGPKIVPYSEYSIAWSHDQKKHHDQGTVIKYKEKDQFVLTGTAIRGALRHRTAYHFRRLISHWSQGDLLGSESKAKHDSDAHDPATLFGLNMLFGEAKSSESNTEEAKITGPQGWRGALLTNDACLNRSQAKLQVSDHLSIDRFSGAPIQGALFSDAAIAPQKTQSLSLSLGLAPSQKMCDDQDHLAALELACYALYHAIRDLNEGRLQLGAGAGRGYGYFKGKTSTKWANHSTHYDSLLRALNGELPQNAIQKVAELNAKHKPA